MKPCSMTIGIVAAGIAVGVARADEPAGPMPPPESKNMICTPDELEPGTEMTVVLPKTHGSDFAVIAPNGTFYFISFEQPDSASPIQPIFPADVFRGMTTLAIKVDDTRGVEWKQGGAERALIFRKSGKYRLVVSDNLETEDPELQGFCNVEYRR